MITTVMNCIGFIVVQLVLLVVLLPVVFAIFAGILRIGKRIFDEQFSKSGAEVAEVIYTGVAFLAAICIGMYLGSCITSWWTYPYFFK